ncbi:hypothetical protein [Thermococcus sp.]|uniref:hypothetical protein n=1 Tax=Thermococcus sp. TaxID=35749 RepID=UPI0026088C7F|nr:hypothetical protein [Thermococcus sp.]
MRTLELKQLGARAMNHRTSFVFALLLILLSANAVIAFTGYNAVEIKVYTYSHTTSNVTRVYLDKIIPADQPFHVTLTINGVVYDITYDPNFDRMQVEPLDYYASRRTIIIGRGVRSGYIDGASSVAIRVRLTNLPSPVNAPVPMGVYVLGALLLSVAFFLRNR